MNLLERTEIMQLLIDVHHYQSYLEIGVEVGDNFLYLNCPKKIGVDPDPTSKATLHIPSDEFFKQNKDTFDIIFIDGMHEKFQMVRDIENSVKILNPKGIILVHDILPGDFHTARITTTYDHDGTPWGGDCWEGWLELRTRRKDLYMASMNADYGIGIVVPGKQKLIEFDFTLLYEEKFKIWFKNKKELSNIIQIHEFMKKFIYN